MFDRTVDLARRSTADTDTAEPQDNLSAARSIIVAVAFSVPAWVALAALIWFWP